MAYTQHGPWTSGGAPGIDASFLNDAEAVLMAVNTAATDSHITSDGNGLLTLLGLTNNVSPVTVTGTTAGTARLYQFLRGSVKGIFLHFSGYRNSTATEQTIALPQAFGSYALFMATGGNPPIHIYLSGSVINSRFDVIDGLPGSIGAPGHSSVNSVINGLQIGDVQNAFDAIGLGTSQSSTYTAGIFMIGI